MTEPSRPVAPLEELIARLRKMQACVYLTVEAPVARDLSEGFQQAIQTLDKLSADLAVERAQRQHLETVRDELLAALKPIIEGASDCVDTDDSRILLIHITELERARAAIAKAEGR